MARSYRHQALIEAPLEEVWAVVSDPNTHPDWWPEIVGVEAPDELHEGDSYVRTSKTMPFVDAVDSIWVAERLEHLKEAQFRCTLSGAYAHFTLTPAQDNTYVELETGMDPTSLKWRVQKAVFGLQYKRWGLDVLDALPEAMRSRLGAGAAAQEG
jgi:uncharacterized protein YndB with AHSA1/START domain